MKLKPVLFLLNQGSYLGDNPFVFIEVEGGLTPANTQGIYLFPIDFILEKYHKFPTFQAFFKEYGYRSLWLVERCASITTGTVKGHGRACYGLLPSLAQTFDYTPENVNKINEILDFIQHGDKVTCQASLLEAVEKINQHFFPAD